MSFCPLEKTVEIIDGKWTVLILWYLRDQPLRFSELQRKIPKATQKMLTQQLRHLERHQLIKREVYPEVPPRVEYSLTEHGESLKPILLSLNEWGWAYYESMVSKEQDKVID